MTRHVAVGAVVAVAIARGIFGGEQLTGSTLGPGSVTFPWLELSVDDDVADVVDAVVVVGDDVVVVVEVVVAAAEETAGGMWSGVDRISRQTLYQLSEPTFQDT